MLELQLLPSRDAASMRLVDEIRAAVRRHQRPLISLATGSTFTAFLVQLQREFDSGRLSDGQLVLTHLDEYEGFTPERRGSMVAELEASCPALRSMRGRGTFIPVPNGRDPAALAAHERRLAQLGGVKLQLLGIGRNGHLAFNEPGCDFDAGFHRTALAASTREDAVPRFAPDPVPTHANTAGIASILAAERIVLCAFGANKAAAVAAMREGPVGPACPASVLQRRDGVLVLVDAAATGGSAH